VSWNPGSFAFGVVQVRASQGRRGRDTGSYVDRGERREVRAWAALNVKRPGYHGTTFKLGRLSGWPTTASRVVLELHTREFRVVPRRPQALCTTAGSDSRCPSFGEPHGVSESRPVPISIHRLSTSNSLVRRSFEACFGSCPQRGAHPSHSRSACLPQGHNCCPHSLWMTRCSLPPAERTLAQARGSRSGKALRRMSAVSFNVRLVRDHRVGYVRERA
jgi:hypothetical protein